MSDNHTSWNATAFNTVVPDNNNAVFNSAGTVTIANTLSLNNVSEVTANVVITIHESGLLEFRDVTGNKIVSRQKTLRLLVEKLISCGIAS
jgi:hypothetical protein